MATGKKISQLDAQNEELTQDDLLEGEDVSLTAGTRSRKITFKKLQAKYITQKAATPTDTIDEADIGGIIECNNAGATTFELPERSTLGTKGQITEMVNLGSNDHVINQNSAESGNKLYVWGTFVSTFNLAANNSIRFYDRGSYWVIL